MKALLRFKATTFSDRPWEDVNKSQLPRCAFLQADGDNKSDWHLPYREGTGGIDPDTGMYRECGPVNKGALRAIAAVLGGARNKPGFAIKQSTRDRFEALKKQAGIGPEAQEEK